MNKKENASKKPWGKVKIEVAAFLIRIWQRKYKGDDAGCDLVFSEAEKLGTEALKAIFRGDVEWWDEMTKGVKKFGIPKRNGKGDIILPQAPDHFAFSTALAYLNCKPGCGNYNQQDVIDKLKELGYPDWTLRKVQTYQGPGDGKFNLNPRIPPPTGSGRRKKK